jgi:hypothetical protein
MRYVTRSQTSTGLYQAMNERGKVIGDGRDCSVKVVAVACGVTYDEAQEALLVSGRGVGRGAYHHHISAAVRMLGRNVVRDDNFIRSRLERLRNNSYVVKNLTTRQLAMFPELAAGGTFLLYTSGHVVTLKDGVVHCWSATRPLYIRAAYRVS